MAWLTNQQQNFLIHYFEQIKKEEKDQELIQQLKDLNILEDLRLDASMEIVKIEIRTSAQALEISLNEKEVEQLAEDFFEKHDYFHYDMHMQELIIELEKNKKEEECL